MLTPVSTGRIQSTMGHWTEAPSIPCHVGLSTGQLTLSEQASKKCQREYGNKSFHYELYFPGSLLAW